MQTIRTMLYLYGEVVKIGANVAVMNTVLQFHTGGNLCRQQGGRVSRLQDNKAWHTHHSFVENLVFKLGFSGSTLRRRRAVQT